MDKNLRKLLVCNAPLAIAGEVKARSDVETPGVFPRYFSICSAPAYIHVFLRKSCTARPLLFTDNRLNMNDFSFIQQTLIRVSDAVNKIAGTRES